MEALPTHATAQHYTVPYLQLRLCTLLHLRDARVGLLLQLRRRRLGSHPLPLQRLRHRRVSLLGQLRDELALPLLGALSHLPGVRLG